MEENNAFITNSTNSTTDTGTNSTTSFPDVWIFNDPSKLQWIVLARKISGFISCVLSTWIVIVVLKSRQRQRQRQVYHRLVLGLSVSDAILSLASACSSWPMPTDWPFPIPYQYGNEFTCKFQGFLLQVKSCQSFYNASLMVYFVLVVKYGWRELRLRQIEPYLHGIPLGWGLATATAGAVLDLYGWALQFCWIDSYHYQKYQMAFQYVPVWINQVIVTASAVMLYLHVRRLDRRTQQYKYDMHQHDRQRKQQGQPQQEPVATANISNQTPTEDGRGIANDAEQGGRDVADDSEQTPIEPSSSSDIKHELPQPQQQQNLQQDPLRRQGEAVSIEARGVKETVSIEAERVKLRGPYISTGLSLR